MTITLGRTWQHTTRQLAAQLRVDSIRMTTAAGSGHPTSSMSAADLMAVLITRHLRVDWSNPADPANDHFVLSKGHASPLLYAAWKALGLIDDHALMHDYRRLGSVLEGHPLPGLPGVEVATGSLGQGLPAAVGIALAGQRLDRLPYRVWVLSGDSELAEGSVWEAADKAAQFGLANLTMIVDVNGLGMRGTTEFGRDLRAYYGRFATFGWHVGEVDGHDLVAIDTALAEAAEARRPSVVLARTHKASGFHALEDVNGWHGKPLPPDLAAQAIAELGGQQPAITITAPMPRPGAPAAGPAGPVEIPSYPLGELVSTRKAYGQALAALGARPDVVVVDAEVGNSTNADAFQRAHPYRYFDVYTADQQMVGLAIGLQVRGYNPYLATFGAFLTRAHDFLRMAGVAGARLRVVGSHAGVEVGPDGPSQMALEDLAMMRAIHDSSVLYPSDANSAAQLTALMADLPGIAYLRTTRGAYPVLYPPGEHFPVGGSKVLRHSDADEVTLIGAGVTVHTSLAAAELLAADGITARVIDVYSIKPIDATTIAAAANATGRVVVAEDSHPEGGLGEAVLSALEGRRERAIQVEHLAVRVAAHSGSTAELLDYAGLSARHIAAAAKRLGRSR
jgi:transketolase